MKTVYSVILLSILLSSCTVLYFDKSVEGNPRMDFTKGVFLINKVDAPNKNLATLLELNLEQGLIALIDSVRNITRENLPELKQDTSLHRYPEELVKTLQPYHRYHYLVCLEVYSNAPYGGGFAFGEVDLDSRVFIRLKFFDVVTGEMYCDYNVSAEEDRLSDDGKGLVFTKSEDTMFQRCLNKALNMVKKNAVSLKKT